MNFNYCKRQELILTAISNIQTWKSSAHMCETELEKDHKELYSSDPEGPYMDEPIADDEWLAEYNREVEQNERRN